MMDEAKDSAGDASAARPGGQWTEFSADIDRLLDILVHSLYSDRGVFLRELISNAADACDKRRWLSLTESGAKGADRYAIQIRPDRAAGRLVIADNGIGMDRDELGTDLGRLAYSDTRQFMERIEGQADGPSLIGQFGIGFYAVFLVSEWVEVVSRKAGATESWVWASNGRGGFELSPAPERLALAEPGTRVELVLRKQDGGADWTDRAVVRDLVRSYSNHIPIPVEWVEGDETELLNQASALWTRRPAEISEEEYAEFYRHIADLPGAALAHIHAQIEGLQAFDLIIFIPDRPPLDLLQPDHRSRLRLYVRRVFVTGGLDELTPGWLRFLRGVVDSADLPLNVSREALTQLADLPRLRRAITSRVLDLLDRLVRDDTERYEKIWQLFGAVLKEGLYEPGEYRQRILRLARFRTSVGDGWVSLAEYGQRMVAGQEHVYYLIGDDADKLRSSPHIEGAVSRGIEVLLLSDGVDDFWTMAMRFDEIEDVCTDKKVRLASLAQEGVELGHMAGEESKAEDAAQQQDATASRQTDIDALVALWKLDLDGKVRDVVVSKNLTESPVSLLGVQGGLDMRVERVLRAHQHFSGNGERVLEINPRHPAIQALAASLASGSAATKDIGKVGLMFLELARLSVGEKLEDESELVRMVSGILVQAYTS